MVPTDIPLDHLHIVIQIVMGWENAHLHRFVIDRQPYCEQPEDPIVEGKDERGVSLSDALNGGVDPFAYDYDFGDDWGHLIEIERKMESIHKDHPVLCTDGAHACPAEDSCSAYWCEENPEEYEGVEFDLNRINRDLQEYLEWVSEQCED